MDYGIGTPSPLAISSNDDISHGIVRGNTIQANMDYNGAAGINLAGSYITIENNFISGVADDIISVQGSAQYANHVIIRNNFCYGLKGSIFLTNCQHFLVEGNYVERAPDPSQQWWQGALLWCDIEGFAPLGPCTDGRIVNNELVIPQGAFPVGSGPGYPGDRGVHQMMIIGGARRVIVANNLLRCDVDPALGSSAGFVCTAHVAIRSGVDHPRYV